MMYSSVRFWGYHFPGFAEYPPRGHAATTYNDRLNSSKSISLLIFHSTQRQTSTPNPQTHHSNMPSAVNGNSDKSVVLITGAGGWLGGVVSASPVAKHYAHPVACRRIIERREDTQHPLDLGRYRRAQSPQGSQECHHPKSRPVRP